MPVRLSHLVLSLVVGASAIADLNLAFPVEIVRWMGGVPFAALLVNLPGAVGVVRGVPVLTICRIQLAITRAVVRDVTARGIALAAAALTTFRPSSRWLRA